MNDPLNPLEKSSTDELFADDETVVISNSKVKKQESKRRKNEVKNIEIASNITKVEIKPRINEAIGDTGTTGNFVLPGAPVDDIKVAENSTEIEMPNGAIERSTHTCYFRIPGLPKELRKAHIVTGLSHSSLVSIKKCRGGCVVIFKDIICEVWYNGT